MSDNQNKDTQNQIVDGVPVFLPDSLKAVSYTNNIYIQYAAEEFGLDFLNMSATGGAFVARVVLTPTHMKRFKNILVEKVNEYEKMFGEIPLNIEPKK